MPDSTFTPDEVEQRREDYRFSWEVGRRIMARPGFMQILHMRKAELDRLYSVGDSAED